MRKYKSPVSVEPQALYDRFLLFAAVSIILIGLLMVASSSIVISERQYHTSFHYLLRQVVYLSLGLFFALLTLRIDIKLWQNASPMLLLFSIGLLIAVLVPKVGHSVNGSMRWIGLGFFRMQVSEIAKVTIILFMAGYCVRREDELRTKFSGFVKPMVIVAIMAALLLKEPDFGATVVIMSTTLGILFLAGVRLWQYFVLLGCAGASVALLAISSPYRLARMTTFLDPWQNQFDSGYQLTQSLIAFGRGGWFGVGLGESIQKLFYLPEAHTDFLFAVLAEELGLVGILVVIGLFTLLVYRAFKIGRNAMRIDFKYGAYVSYGLALLIGLQAMINIGVNSGVLPTKGLTLPLMSYGGSSMIVNCVVIALLLRIDYETRHLRG